MTPHNYVSISERRQRTGKSKWRVAAKRFSGDLNRLDMTLAERMVNTERQAQSLAKEWSATYSAKIL